MKKWSCVIFLLILVLIVVIYSTMLVYIKNTKHVMCMFVVVLLTAIVSSYALMFYSMNNTHYIYHIKNNNKRILQLVLYNEHTPYEVKMKSLTEKYYNQWVGTDTYYYTYSELYDSITIRGNVCYVPGKETYIPGILDKTIKVLDYFMTSSTKYDYIIRSNISTIINFKLLMPTIHEYDYGGPMVNILYWFDYKSGVKDVTYFFTPYIVGTAIIMKDALVRQIIKHKHAIRYDVIDDLSIGYLIKHHLPTTTIHSYLNEVWFSDSMFTESITPTFIFYRNKSQHREDDVVTMEYIIQLIS
jgi:hypothetical protein